MSAYVQRAILREMRKGRHRVPRVMKTIEAKPTASSGFDAMAYVRRAQRATHGLLAEGRPPRDPYLYQHFLENFDAFDDEMFAEAYRCLITIDRTMGRCGTKDAWWRDVWARILKQAAQRGLASPSRVHSGAYHCSDRLDTSGERNLWLHDMRQGRFWSPEHD